MSRPGGNPELDKHQFDKKYSWDEPCTAQLGLRLPPSLYEELKTLDNWQEKTRKAIAKLVLDNRPTNEQTREQQRSQQPN
ncbi:MAG: hypothetical protein QNJ55_25745 [Xenococcus sp. MO_188.B8]|nr:hypothetical protein [Xenococcus sp. MO_188.B8]